MAKADKTNKTAKLKKIQDDFYEGLLLDSKSEERAKTLIEDEEDFADEQKEADPELDDIVNDLPESDPETILDDVPLKKRGVLSIEECNYIKENADKISIAQIARDLNRRKDPIEKYVKMNHLVEGLVDDEEEQRINLRTMLQTKDYWLEVRKQFNKEELEYFTTAWCSLILQFREDVLFSEELEIKQFITLDILINRNLSEQNRARQEVDKLQRQIDKEYLREPDFRDRELIGNLEAQISFARTAIPAYAAEYTKLLDKRGAIAKDLKATRDQRVKRVEDSKSSWASYIRMLEDEVVRAKEGDEIELMRLAKDKVAKDLGKYHTYVDGTVDRPLLNSETVMYEG